MRHPRWLVMLLFSQLPSPIPSGSNHFLTSVAVVHFELHVNDITQYVVLSSASVKFIQVVNISDCFLLFSFSIAQIFNTCLFIVPLLDIWLL